MNFSHKLSPRYEEVMRNGCHVIKPGNATLAADWENIPETLILNATIGTSLFVLFLWLTNIGWRRTDTEDKLKSQNIVSFLYGYRDPEQWYVIPRFEFLRHEDRHHQHDLDYAYIYAPPKLPLANPFELFAYAGQNNENGEQSKSIDSQDRARPIDLIKLPGVENEINLVHDDSSHEDHSRAAIISSGSSQTGSSSTTTNGSKRHSRGRSVDSGPSEASSVISAITQRTRSSPLGKPTSESRPMMGGRSISEQATKTKNNDPNSVEPLSSNAPQVTKEATKEPHSTGNVSSGFNQSIFYPSILTAEQLQASSLSRKLNRFFGMLFRVTDADIIYARGIDAYEYLLFQRHLILIAAITSVLCLCVILPIHWFAGSQKAELLFATSFQRSTIKNIETNTHFHWAHIICSSVIVISALRIMRSYRESIISPKDQQLSRRTLLIGNIPAEQRSRAYLQRVLREHFPRNTIEAIQFVYDTSQLDHLETCLSSTIVARDYCQAYKRKFGRELQVHKTDVNLGRTCSGYCRCCSFCYICCCYWTLESKESGTSYYAREEDLYRRKISQTCLRLVQEPTEYAFITFKSHKQARRVMKALAKMKQEVLEGRRLGSRINGVDVVSTAAVPSLDRRATGGTRAGSKRSSSARMRRDAGNGHLVRDAGTSETLSIEDHHITSDPMDPKNDPHLRSIRSYKRSPSAAIIESSGRAATGTSESVTTVPELLSEPSAVKTGRRLGHLRHLHSSYEAVKHLDGPIMWSVRYAPHPDNVEFQDLLNLTRTSKYTIVFLHLLMIVIFIFITTPNVVLSMIERISVLRPDKAVQLTGFQGLVINYLSILLQIVTTALLPTLVTLISKQIPYEDSATKGHSVMWKVYLFLILMVIIMPSIGMSSALAFFESHIDANCLFPTDNGAYYINYIISSIFLSTVLELIKPVDILSYYFILWTSRSTAEIEGGRQFIEREFSVGMQHTGVLLIFAVMMTYSISCPLIAPVGLIYLIVKHCVDHYNLYYTYFTKKVDKDLQSTIVMFVKVGLTLMLFQTAVAIYIHTGTSYFSLISQVIFWITLMAFAFDCFFDCTSRTRPPPVKRSRYQHDFCACFYLPRVIASLLRFSAIPPGCISRKV